MRSFTPPALFTAFTLSAPRAPSVLLATIMILALAVFGSSLRAEAASNSKKFTRGGKIMNEKSVLEEDDLSQMPLVLRTPAQQSEFRRGLSMEVFIDTQAKITNKDTVNDRGFTLNDAAIYVSKDFKSDVTAFVDLPFYSELVPGSSRFVFAEKKAQAYLAIRRLPVAVRLGQFDTIYGIERNDSRDRFFADNGVVKEYIIPDTHAGLLGGFSSHNNGIDFVIRGLIANPSDQTNLANNNPEFGAQFRLEGARGYGAFGFLLNEAKNVPTNSTNMLINAVGGFAFDKFRIDGEFDNKKTATVDTSATAFMLLGTYQHTDDLGFGGRLEYLTDPFVPGTGVLKTITAFAVGSSYKLEEGLVVRGDFSLSSFNAANAVGGDETVYGVNLSVVASL